MMDKLLFAACAIPNIELKRDRCACIFHKAKIRSAKTFQQNFVHMRHTFLFCLKNGFGFVFIVRFFFEKKRAPFFVVDKKKAPTIKKKIL